MLKRINFKNINLLLLLVLLLFVVLRVPSLFEPHWYGDEGTYSAVAYKISNGGLLYKDAWDNKFPGIYYIYLIGHYLGNTLVFVKFINLLFGLGTIITLHLIVLKFLTKKKAIIFTFFASLVFNFLIFEFNIANAENFFILFTTIGIYFLINRRFIISGFSFGCGIIFKFNPVVEVIFLFLFILLNNVNLKNIKIKSLNINSLKFLISSIIPLSLFSIYYIFRGNFLDFISSSILGNFSYVNNVDVSNNIVTKLYSSLAFKSIVFLMILLNLIFLKNTSFLNISNKIENNKEEKYSNNLNIKRVILVWVLSSIFGSIISNRAYPHYNIEFVPSLLLLLALIFNINSYKNLLRRGSIIIFILITFVTINFKNNFSELLWGFKNTLNYYPNFFNKLTNKISDKSYVEYFNNEAGKIYEVSDYIKKNYTPKTTTYFADNNPWFYELANVTPASKYITYYHLFFGSDRDKELIYELNKQKTKLIVIPKRFSLFNELQNLIDSNYTRDNNYISNYYLLFFLKN